MNAPAQQPDDQRLPSTEVQAGTFVQPPSQMATNWLTPTNLASGLQIAELMAKCRLVPQHLQGSVSDCLLVLSQAARWGMDPFAVAQSTAVVRGKLCFEGKLVAAALVATGAVEGGLDYEFTGEGPRMAITITGIVRRTGKAKTLMGSVAGWRTENGQWDKDPQSMLVYRGTRQWCRLYCPETILGVVTPDELQEVKDAQEVTVTSGESPSGVVPAVKAPKARKTKEPEAAPAPVDEKPAEPDPRSAELLRLAEDFVEDQGSLAIAELRAIASQLGVKKLQETPADKLDDAIAAVRKSVAALRSGDG